MTEKEIREIVRDEIRKELGKLITKMSQYKHNNVEIYRQDEITSVLDMFNHIINENVKNKFTYDKTQIGEIESINEDGTYTVRLLQSLVNELSATDPNLTVKDNKINIKALPDTKYNIGQKVLVETSCNDNQRRYIKSESPW